MEKELWTPFEITYLFASIRLLSDQNYFPFDVAHCRLFANWLLHINISNPGVQAILQTLDDEIYRLSQQDFRDSGFAKRLIPVSIVNELYNKLDNNLDEVAQFIGVLQRKTIISRNFAENTFFFFLLYEISGKKMLTTGTNFKIIKSIEYLSLDLATDQQNIMMVTAPLIIKLDNDPGTNYPDELSYSDRGPYNYIEYDKLKSHFWI